jgi:hypothetical protein
MLPLSTAGRRHALLFNSSISSKSSCKLSINSSTRFKVSPDAVLVLSVSQSFSWPPCYRAVHFPPAGCFFSPCIPNYTPPPTFISRPPLIILLLHPYLPSCFLFLDITMRILQNASARIASESLRGYMSRRGHGRRIFEKGCLEE